MALKIASGDFRTRVTLYSPTTVKDDGGGTEIGHTVAFSTNAAERRIDQKRVAESGGTMLLDTRLMYLRYDESRSVINKDWLIEIGGSKYTIHAKPLVVDSGLRCLEIICKSTHNG